MTDSPPVLRPPRLVAKTTLPCVEVRPEFGPYQEAVIDTPGKHCIAVDFWQQRLSDFAGHTGPAPYRHLLGVMANDVTVDLANHTLHSDGNSGGIVAERIEQGEKPMPKNTTVQNGVLEIRGLGTAVDFLDHWPMSDINTPAPKNFPGFKKSGVILENLLIRADNVGVMLEGDGNIIRNCVIESGGDSAIMMAGPNGKILNNTIILTDPLIPTWLAHGNKGIAYQIANLSDFRKTPRAAIALHRATGTVIRDNRIEVKGKSSSRHNIYLTDTSIGVQIEGNTFVGMDDPVTLTNGSTANLKNNTYEQTLPWWQLSNKINEKHATTLNKVKPADYIGTILPKGTASLPKK
ncbi:right-handed parallel beta-helix repeat-containing protein [Janthinobacterium svalbardensis]|uniref:right-handed parallel beta-helix repeat-containing protein n=1 Tax=Janthinobacterium svalbardensis TaxID=368607 RepID=UPI002FCDA5F6